MSNTDEGLKRVVGVPGIALIVVNNTIGAGIFALPAIISLQLGAYGITSYIFCGIMMAAIMLCYMEIGTKVTTTGGSYAYVEAAFGSFAAFIINWLYFFGWGVLGSAAVINIIADSLSMMFPLLTNSLIRALLFFVLLGFIVLMNVRGTKETVWFLKFVTIIKLLPLFGIIIFGFRYVKAANFNWEHLPTFKTFGDTTLLLFFAFANFESSLSVSGEIKNPKQSIPSGIFIGGMLVLIVYTLIQIVTQGILGEEMRAFKDAPLAAIAQKMVGPVGATILIIATAFSCFGNLSGDVLATPRLLFAGAKDGMFPKYLAKVHPTFATPYWAVITYGVLIFIFSISGTFKQLAVLASAAILLIYIAVILATIKLRSMLVSVEEKTFKMPGGLIIPVIGIAAIIWLLTSLSKSEIMAIIIYIAVICTIYYLMVQFKKIRNPQ